MATVRSGPVERSLWVLEVVAERGGASAREIADACGLPLPTVYRLAKELVDADYLVHICGPTSATSSATSSISSASRCTTSSA